MSAATAPRASPTARAAIAGTASSARTTPGATGLDGTLKSVPPWQGFEGMDLTRHSLAPLEQEIWRGFIFVRMEQGASFPSPR